MVSRALLTQSCALALHHRNCPNGYLWLEPPTLNIPSANCYRDCALLTVAGTTFGAYVAYGGGIWVPVR